MIKSNTPRLNFEEHHRRENGFSACVRTSKLPLLNEAGEIIGVFGTFEDISDRKRAETALAASERKYRLLVETSQDLIWSVDLEGRYTFINPAARKIFGYEPQEMLGRSLTDFQASECIQKDRETFEQVLSGQPIAQYETTYRAKEGRKVYLAVNAVALLDEDGQVIGITGTSSDITQRKQVELELQKTRTFLESVLKNLPIGVTAKNARDMRYVLWNRGAEKLKGYLAGEVLGKTDYDFHPAWQAETFISQDQAVLNSGQTLDIAEEEVTIASGEIRFFHTQKTIISDTEGKPEYLLLLLEDITERKRAVDALRQSEARFQRVVANVPGMIYQFRLDPNGQVSFPYVSNFCQDLYGIEPAVLQADAHLILDCIHPEDRQDFDAAVRRSAETLQSWEWTGRSLYRATGQYRWLKGISRPERQADGSVIWDGLLVDITDRKQAETQLRQQTVDLANTLRELQNTQAQLIQSEKMSSLGQLVAGVAHEINNPVGFISGNLNHASEYTENLLHLIHLYQTHYPDPVAAIEDEMAAIEFPFLVEDLPKLITSMRVGADRIQGIVASLRTFSRMDEADMKSVDIHEGIDSTLMILQSRLKHTPNRPGIEVIKAYGDLPMVECYAGQLNQVFMNLLTNAIDALEEAMAGAIDGEAETEEFIPAIQIHTELTASQRICICIADNGRGIAEKARNRLFDPFFTTKPVGKGTGMGLSISYQIVAERHGGTLQCVSMPGQGAEFRVEIPVRQV